MHYRINLTEESINIDIQIDNDLLNMISLPF